MQSSSQKKGKRNREFYVGRTHFRAGINGYIMGRENPYRKRAKDPSKYREWQNGFTFAKVEFERYERILEVLNETR